MSKFNRGDKVIWIRSNREQLIEGTIEDGPHKAPDYGDEGIAYVVHFVLTSRLLAEEVLRLKDEERWVTCEGQHRVRSGSASAGDAIWEKKETI